MATPAQPAKTPAAAGAKAPDTGAAATAKGPQPGKGAPAGAAKPTEGAAPKTGKKRRWLMVTVVLLVVLVGAGGGAAWYLKRGAETTQPPAKAAAKKSAVEAKAAPAKPPKPGVFVPLDNFTVNLQPDPNEQYLQTQLSLKVEDNEVAETAKRLMPEIRNRILLLLSSKRSSDLSTTQGKQLLATQIGSEVNQVLNMAAGKSAVATKVAAVSSGGTGKPEAAAPVVVDGPVMSVFFTQFIIQ